VFWDDRYREQGHVWGSEPSELAKIVSRYLQECLPDRELRILDLGCGYGRDALYLSKNYNAAVLGIDISQEAVSIASRAVPKPYKKRVTFQQQDFRRFDEGRYDVVFSSNLYQLLREDERRKFVKTVVRVLEPNGLLFLSTLSVNDPEHSGKGTPILGEPNSFQDVVYLHLCTKKELQRDFASLKILELFEHEFHEPRVTGEIHHHISWILIGEYSS